MEFNITNLYDTLNFLVGPAGIAAWMLFASDLIRNRTTAGAFASWSSLGIQLFTAGLSFGVPALAYILFAVIPPDLYAVIQPHYGFVASCFVAYITQQGYFWVKGNIGVKSG